MNYFHGTPVPFTVRDNHGNEHTVVPIVPDGGTSGLSNGSGMTFTI